jgi:hypothetical protein
MYTENDVLVISTKAKTFFPNPSFKAIHTLVVEIFVRLIESYSTTATLSKYLTTRLSINFKV